MSVDEKKKGRWGRDGRETCRAWDFDQPSVSNCGTDMSLGEGDRHLECKSCESLHKMMLILFLCFIFSSLRNFAMFCPEFHIYLYY